MSLIFLQACGTPLESYDVLTNPDEGEVEGLVLGVKDVSDMINFDQQQVRHYRKSRVPVVDLVVGYFSSKNILFRLITIRKFEV